MAVNYIALGMRIKAARKHRGISKLKLADKMDCSVSYISYIEGGVKSLSLDTLVAIANALSVTADELLMDNLENNIKVSSAEFSSILMGCSDYERRVLLESIRSTKWGHFLDLSPRSCYYRLD